jgi:hypothetical protein
MQHGVVGAVVAVFAVASGVNLNARNASSSIRPESRAVRALIDRGLERSGTFRDLVRELDNADILVYVRFSRCDGGVPACLLWASSGSAPRRLLIKIDRFGRSENDLTALLAHELQHAFEVASAPGVTDVTSFQQWFEAHGWRGSDGFETNKAEAVSRKVTAELCHYAVPTRIPD